MPYFCENCGTKLDTDAVFCENCGAKITTVNLKDNLEIFTRKDWSNVWKTLTENPSCDEYGIILINTANLSEPHYSKFMISLASYVYNRFNCGVSYCVLDIANQSVRRPLLINKIESVDFVVKTLRDISRVRIPDYLLIVGDRNCINSANWKNGVYSGPYGDSDQYVDSDIPYATLSSTSLFNGGSFDFLIKVGRIPTSSENGFSEAMTYFESVKPSIAIKNVRTVALGAVEWSGRTEGNFKNSDADIYECPSYSYIDPAKLEKDKLSAIDSCGLRVDTLNPIPHQSAYDLYCFNLHGGPQIDYWVSGSHHLAFSPEVLPDIKNRGYVIATEACYGAKPVIRKGSQSILVSALGKNCWGFLGSTQIAYGTATANQPIRNADAMIGKFAEYVSDGYNIGSSYMKALLFMTGKEGGGCTTPEDVKTVTTFALYGDPTVALTKTTRGKTVVKDELSTTVILPDISRFVELKLNVVSEEIQKRFYHIIYNQHGEFKDLPIIVYKCGSNGTYRATCSKTDNGITKILIMYINEKDGTEIVYISK